MTSHHDARYPYLLPAVAMMLGWGLRGFIGGGPLGAMIPGAMVATAICLQHGRSPAAVLAAFGAVGVGFGGEMTYGQTVGFIVNAETFWWGFLGLALKGAIWGALGGAMIALGMTPRPRLVLGAGAVISAASWIGWKLINEPKLIYFSNRLDKPRPEIWAGFALAAVALAGFLAWRGLTQPALKLALAGFVGGGIGFGFGGAIQGLGRIFAPGLKLHWWKYMEFFFGFCFGWALAWALRRVVWPADPEPDAPPPPVWVEITAGAATAAALFWLPDAWELRFAWLVVGSAVLVVVARYRWLAWQVAYTVTFAAAAFDLARYWSLEYKRGAPEPAYAAAVIASLAFAWLVRRWRADHLRLLELLTWACVADATVKFAIHPSGVTNVVDHVAIAFLLMAAAVNWMARREARAGV
jgi:hypothetical protein